MFERWGNPYPATITPRWRGTKKTRAVFSTEKERNNPNDTSNEIRLIFYFSARIFSRISYFRYGKGTYTTMKFGNEGHIFYRGPQVKFFVVTSGM